MRAACIAGSFRATRLSAATASSSRRMTAIASCFFIRRLQVCQEISSLIADQVGNSPFQLYIGSTEGDSTQFHPHRARVLLRRRLHGRPEWRPTSTGVQVTRTRATIDGLPLREQKEFFLRYARFDMVARDTRNYRSTTGQQTCEAGERKNGAQVCI